MSKQYKLIVSAIILNDQGQVLLGKRSMSEESFPGMWGVPGGTVDAEETTDNIIEDTLIRESEEEMGITIKPLNYLESSCRVKNDVAKVYMIFTAKHVSGEPQALEDTDAVQWWNISDLKEDEVTPGVFKILTERAHLLR